MNHFLLSFRMLRRDWRAGELNVLVLALIIAISGLTTVGFFADRVGMALARESNQLLGADLLVMSSKPLPPHFAEEAEKLGLTISSLTKFPSMISNGDGNLLTEIKAVAEGYPLRGRVHVAGRSSSGANANPGIQVAEGIPVPGTIWADEKVMTRLDLKIGDVVDIGAIQLKVTELVVREPDHSVGFINMGARAIINTQDLADTELIQEGSRVSYQLLVAGDMKTVQQFRTWAQGRLAKNQKIEGIRDARPEIKAALERAEKFLSLAALVSVVLAAAAIALAVRRFTLRHLDGCAIMRSLGASQKQLLTMYVSYFITLGIIASGLGCLIGFAAQQILAHWLTDIVETALPWPTWWPAIHGLLVGLVLLVGFALPPVLNLRSVPALRVLRRDVGLPNAHSLWGYGAGLAALLLLFIWKAHDLKLGLYIVAGFVSAIVVFGSVGWLLIKLLSNLRHQAGGAWRYGLASLHRRAASSVLQAVALGLGLMALLVLTLIQDDLINDWNASLPPDAPNHFLVNIQADQLQPLEEFFQQYAMERPPLFPMIRGRLIKINGKNVSPQDYADDTHAERHIRREFNLSWTDELARDNSIVQGSWWKKDTRDTEMSIEADIAKTLRIKLGDELTFDIAGQHFSAKITSLRKVDWDSFRVNFFVVVPPGLLEDYPASYITSFYVPPSEIAMIHELVRMFPNILVVDVALVIGQVQQMIQQVSEAIKFVFIFTVLAGFAVLYAAIAATQDERIYEAAIFRTLGARREQLLRAWATEFAILGGLSGLFASAGASGLGYVIGKYALHLDYTFNPWIWVIGTSIGLTGVLVGGLLGTRAALSSPPLLTLRKIA
ncbi:ABC transporter permease [Nitrosomonas sp. JL21]|uniref:ABC transporter permease n=1 Tax=Nitrosomonas sp. JL21 TaxID=153949 RepID=UPI0013694A12|nr:FtsX-like permease family protein [Nitrosomonas sp. JL21]MBL8497539.1 FtsX-like permease family protein [Nitrosomonas sp.]MXS78636.1 ABC transporter permease [Nitrosomonas sp. JL21]